MLNPLVLRNRWVDNVSVNNLYLTDQHDIVILLANNLNIVVPDPTIFQGKEYVIKLTDNYVLSGCSIQMYGGADPILLDGSTLGSKCVTLVSDGADWQIIGRF